MNRFDIAVVLVTFAILGVAAIIRGIVVPVVRLRVSRYRLASGPSQDGQDVARLRAEVRELQQRNLELESRLLAGEPSNLSRVGIKEPTR